MDYGYRLIRSARKTLCLEISNVGEVIVRAPYTVSDSDIEGFVSGHTGWIEKKLTARKNNSRLPEPDAQQTAQLKKIAREYIPARVAYFGEIMGLKPASVKITSAKTRFGSCSGKNALCFSWRLMRYPPEAIDYVAVHELAHMVHHNHSKRFYALIGRYLPDYHERIAMLKK